MFIVSDLKWILKEKPNYINELIKSETEYTINGQVILFKVYKLYPKLKKPIEIIKEFKGILLKKSFNKVD